MYNCATEMTDDGRMMMHESRSAFVIKTAYEESLNRQC